MLGFAKYMLAVVTMLPSTGKFKEINCPFFDSGLCERPYCHFRHVKKDSDNLSLPVNSALTLGENGEILQHLVSEAVRKVLQQTEILPGALATSSGGDTTDSVSHSLVTKVVEELAPPVNSSSQPSSSAHASQQNVPSYKPTPIAVLKRRHIPIPYSPSLSKSKKTSISRKRLNSEEIVKSQKKQKSQDVLNGFIEHKCSASAITSQSQLQTDGASCDSDSETYEVDKDVSNTSPKETSQYSPAPVVSWKDCGISYTPSVIGSLSNQQQNTYVPSSKKPLETPTVEYEPSEKSASVCEPTYEPLSKNGAAGTNTSYEPSSVSHSEPEYQPLCTDTFTKEYVPTDISTLECIINDDTLDFDSFTTEIDLLHDILRKELNGSDSGEEIEVSAKLKNHQRERVHIANIKKEGENESVCKESKSVVSGKSKAGSEERKSTTDKSRRECGKKRSSSSSNSDSKRKKNEVDKRHGESQKRLHESKLKAENDKRKSNSEDESQKRKKIESGRKSNNEKKSEGEKKKSEGEKNKSEGEKKKSEGEKKKSEGEKKKSEGEKKKSEGEKKKSESEKKKSDDREKNKGSTHYGHKHRESTKSSVKLNNSDHKPSGKGEKEHKRTTKHSSIKKRCESDKIHEKHYSGKTRKNANKHGTANNVLERVKKERTLKKEKHLEAECKSLGKSSHAKTIEDLEGLAEPEAVSEPEDFETVTLPDDTWVSSSDEDAVTKECFRIFQEYEPVKVDKKKTALQIHSDPLPEAPVLSGKKRKAHDGAENCKRLPSPKKRPPPLNPTQLMLERYQKLKEKRAALIKEKESVVISPPTSVSTLSVPGVVVPSGGKVRIAHVPNVSLLLDAKHRMQQRILERRKSGATADDIEATRSQTISKGNPRVAHIPSERVLSRPLIANEIGGKIPSNVRQNYLNMLVDEYLKVCSEQEAYDKAAEEEKTIYGRSTTRLIYTSHVSNTIGRLRRARQAGGASSTVPNGLKLPTNRTVSHTSVLAGKGGSKGSWSIEKPRKPPPSVTNKSLYEQLSQFIMSEELLKQNGFPRPHPEEKGAAVIHAFYKKPFIPKTPQQRMCARCFRIYYVNPQGRPVKDEQCVYHWGRLFQSKTRGGWEARYSCCQGPAEAVGCSVGSSHVSENIDPNNLRGFVRTLPKDAPPKDGDYGVYALDCEMCYTTGGLELTRVTVISSTLQVVYESLVKPESPILDFNTRFSGIREEDLVGIETSIYEVQSALLSFINDKTILIGHSLESDFKALKLIHDTVVDTSVVYPHKMGPPKKRALKSLCRELLHKIIQEDEGGHDSSEDARAAMELMLFRVKEEMKSW